MEKYSADEIENGRKLFAGNCEFKIGATQSSHVPDSEYPEVAFVGRSNVGKSSLVNALTGRNSLARTSSNPGHTRQLNFFLLRDALMLVDLPGYGYAQASKKDIQGWTNLMLDYLKGRPQLRRVCLLIDARHGAKESDYNIMTLLDDVAVNYQIILTKIDKTKKNSVEKIISAIKSTASKHAAMHPDIIITSSDTGEGIDILRAELTRFIKGRD